jgi:hypothetical protein
MIIQHPNKSYYSTSTSQFYKGIINPLTKKIINKIIGINSVFRDNYYKSLSTNYETMLPFELKNVLSMKLLDISIPNSYITISKTYGNNFFLIKLDSTNELKKIIIPDGNYTPDSIVDYLNNIMTLLGGDFSELLFAINRKNPTDSGELIVGVKTTAPYVFNFSLIFGTDLVENQSTNIRNPINLQMTFGWLMGFRYDTYREKSVYVSEGIINFIEPKYIFLCIDDYNNNVNNNFTSCLDNSILNNNILAKIMFNENKNKNKTKKIINPIRNYFGPVNISKLHIQLVDEYGRIINLNNMDYSFTLMVEMSYNI